MRQGFILGNVTGLKCRECGKQYDVRPINRCEYCFGPLEVEYNYERLSKLVTRKRLRRGPDSLWRFRELLPLENEGCVDLGGGNTPLLRADRLARAIGLRSVFIKNECFNPTYSVKDRMVSVAVSKAVEFQYETVACASTGNLAQSLAAHAARAGLQCVIFQPLGAAVTRQTAAGAYGATVIGVDGGTAEINRLCTEAAARSRWAFINVHLRPFYAEGPKTIAFEIADQLEWSLPNHVIAPMASGALLAGMARGFDELRRLALIRGSDAHISGVQPRGCSPIVTAFENNTNVIMPVQPNTMAASLSVSNPADGIYALNAIRDTGGTAVGVNDNEIIEGMKLLARAEGIYSDPSGGAVVAALRRLVEKRRIRVAEQIVLIIPAKGLAAPEATEPICEPAYTMQPNIAALRDLLKKMGGEA